MESTEMRPETMSVQDWFITLLITAIPILGFIMLFVWGFGDGATTAKANWAKATLLWLAVVALFYFFIAVLFGIGMMSSMG